MKPQITYEDFEKLDLRTATIKKAEEIPEADKLLKLTLDVGELGEKTICAGIKQHYNKEELEGKQIILLANLEPRKMRGIESQGMLLAASTQDHSEVFLLKPDKEINSGSSVN